MALNHNILSWPASHKHYDGGKIVNFLNIFSLRSDKYFLIAPGCVVLIAEPKVPVAFYKIYIVYVCRVSL